MQEVQLEEEMQAPITVGLPSKKEMLSMGNFASDGEVEAWWRAWEEKTRSKAVAKEITAAGGKKLEEIEANPGDYLNFGFSLADYQVFLRTLFLKRTMRKFLESGWGQPVIQMLGARQSGEEWPGLLEPLDYSPGPRQKVKVEEGHSGDIPKEPSSEQ
jgi:hypothetical protein